MVLSYGYRKIYRDLRDMEEACGKHRVAKIMKREGYVRKPVISAVRGIMVARARWRPRTRWHVSLRFQTLTSPG